MWRRSVQSVSLVAAILAGTAARPVAAEAIPYYGGPDVSKLNLVNASAARNSFLAALSVYGVEDLEDIEGQPNPTLSFTGTKLAARTGFANGVNSHMAYSVSGFNFLWDTDGVDDWLQFSAPVTAFGAYIVQGGDGSSAPPLSTPPNRLTFRLENTALGTSKEVVIHDLGPDWPFYNVNFVGVTDTEPFDRISLHESYDHDGLLWDDLIAGHVTFPVPADFNNDRFVDGGDLEIWRSNFSVTNLPPYTAGDVNGDGVADGADFLIWQRQYDPPPAAAAAAAVPEPTSLCLLLAGLGIARAIRRA
jgi:hypothetical protein